MYGRTDESSRSVGEMIQFLFKWINGCNKLFINQLYHKNYTYPIASPCEHWFDQ